MPMTIAISACAGAGASMSPGQAVVVKKNKKQGDQGHCDKMNALRIARLVAMAMALDMVVMRVKMMMAVMMVMMALHVL